MREAANNGDSITLEQVLVGQGELATPIRNVHHLAVAAINITAQLSAWPAARVKSQFACHRFELLYHSGQQPEPMR